MTAAMPPMIATVAKSESSDFKPTTSPADQSSKSSPQRKARVDFKSLWGRRYAQLVEFKRVNGHCNVPQRYAANVELGRWVKDQRTFKVKGKLSEERISLLEDIGFQWRLKCHDDFWQKMCEDLKVFKTTNGHCDVSMSNADNIQLARWADRIRRSKRTGKISQERIKQLDELGFSWSGRG